jgi:sodium/proline symporter
LGSTAINKSYIHSAAQGGPRRVLTLSVLGIALLATLMATDPQSQVLGLVGYAWAGFGAAFGPVIILSLFWRGMTRNGAAAGLIVGAVTVVVWKQLSGGIFEVYEILPGFILSTIAVVVVSRFGPAPEGRVVEDFDRTVVALNTAPAAAPAE